MSKLTLPELTQHSHRQDPFKRSYIDQSTCYRADRVPGSQHPSMGADSVMLILILVMYVRVIAYMCLPDTCVTHACHPQYIDGLWPNFLAVYTYGSASAPAGRITEHRERSKKKFAADEIQNEYGLILEGLEPSTPRSLLGLHNCRSE